MLKDLFVSEVRVRLFKVFLVNPSKPLHVRALVRQVGTEINAIRRELQRLVDAGVLRKRPSGNRVYYNVNTSSQYYPELLSLVAKEEGLGAEIIKRSKELGDIEYAVLARGFSRGREYNVLDVDLFIVGSVNLDVLNVVVSKTQEELKREINYSVMGEEEFLFRKRRNDAFINKVLSQSRTMLIGDEELFCAV
ncbi:winged helix-turn-helix transcriptional regulator [candidate division WWE3 bacterium]|nr:winged helix-turn-helix transcriptional regulator [candidate division WWE3 bacterium]